MNFTLLTENLMYKLQADELIFHRNDSHHSDTLALDFKANDITVVKTPKRSEAFIYFETDNEIYSYLYRKDVFKKNSMFSDNSVKVPTFIVIIAVIAIYNLFFKKKAHQNSKSKSLKYWKQAGLNKQD